jgi:fatty acid desaturase
MRVFRHAADRIPVLAILALFALDGVIYAWVDSFPWLLAWTLVGFVPKGCVAAFNHHHQHVPTFRVSFLNRLLEVVYGLQTGMTSNAWVLHHCLGHHANYLDQTKDESRWQDETGRVMGPLRYTLMTAVTAYPRAWQVGRGHPIYRRTFLGMGLLTVALLGGAMVYRPVPALMVFLVPMVLSLLVTCYATHRHHSGNDTVDHMVASNNVTHRMYNLFTGNLGLHTAHHYRPGVHWSRLPELHVQIAREIPKECFHEPGLPFGVFDWFVDDRPIGMPLLTEAATPSSHALGQSLEWGPPAKQELGRGDTFSMADEMNRNGPRAPSSR